MSERARNAFKPGKIITIDSVHFFAALEDQIAEYIDPNRSAVERDHWQRRSALLSVVRPPLYSSRLQPIVLEVLGDPYHKLRTATARAQSVRFEDGRPLEDTELLDEPQLTLAERGSQSIGLLISIAAEQSEPGTMTMAQSEIYFLPVSDNYYSGRPVVDLARYGHRIVRLITDPTFEFENFDPSDSESHGHSFESLRTRMRDSRFSAAGH